MQYEENKHHSDGNKQRPGWAIIQEIGVKLLQNKNFVNFMILINPP